MMDSDTYGHPGVSLTHLNEIQEVITFPNITVLTVRNEKSVSILCKREIKFGTMKHCVITRDVLAANHCYPEQYP